MSDLKKTDKNETYMAGKLLLAMPTMGDFRFEKSVIYICAHDEQGAMGLVINNPLPEIDFKDLLAELKIASNIELDPKAISIPVMNGGPVEGARGFLLHSSDFHVKDTIKVDKEISVTGTLDALKDLATGHGPQDKLFILGYAGWGAGQLDEELQKNAWLVVDADPELVFHSSLEEKWDMALKKLGIDPSMLSATGGSA
ncbi:MAG: YqgE/AlgH family protein [Alphaproteobacteria bacterium]